MSTAELWADLHGDPRHALRYPSEHVVRWLESLVRRPGIELALDIGCGSGRHLDLLRTYGYTALGVDVSETEGRLYGDMCELPFRRDLFDVALSFGVFYYGTHADHVQAVSELHRVLKPGGQALVVIRSYRDTRSVESEWDDRWTCRITSGDEKGMLMNFMSFRDIREVYGIFSELSYETSETTRDERRWIDADWIIKVTK